MYPETVGRFGLGRRNERGERLLQLCAMKNLVITNTLFKRKPQRRVTWTSPDGPTKNQIDYIIIQQSQKPKLKNCRVFTSADIDSDHSLLISKMMITIPKPKKLTRAPRKFGTEKLEREDIVQQFKAKFGGFFAPLLSSDCDVEGMYDQFISNTNKATKEVIGFKRRKQVEGMPKELEQLCERRREARRKMIQQPKSAIFKEEYKMLNTEVKNGVKKTKQNQLENKIKQLESDFRANNSHNLFKTLRNFSGKSRKTLNVVKDKKGVKHTLAHEVLKCLENHFKEHLNAELPRDSAAIDNINIPHNDQNHIKDINIKEKGNTESY